MASPSIAGSVVADAELKKLVSEFSKPRPEFEGKSYVTRRRDWFDKPMENIRPLLLKEALPKLSEQHASKIYSEMSVGGRKLYPRLLHSGAREIQDRASFGHDERRHRDGFAIAVSDAGDGLPSQVTRFRTAGMLTAMSATLTPFKPSHFYVRS